MTRHRADPAADTGAHEVAEYDTRVARRRRLTTALDGSAHVRRAVVVWSPRARIAAWSVTGPRRHGGRSAAE